MKLIPFISLYFFLLVFPCYSQEKEWNEAVENLEANRFSEASEKFAAWIERAARDGTYSPEAHYNLFLSQFGLESTANAVAHLLRSIQLDNNPIKNLDSLETLCELQARLGIKEGLCQSSGFKWSLMAGKNFLAVFASLAFWSLMAGIYFLRKKEILRSRFAFGATAFFVLGSVFSYVTLFSHETVMVLTSPDKNVPIFKSPMGEEERLVDLAAGTLVEVHAEVKSGKRFITQPISGWVRESDLISVDKSLSEKPTFSHHSPTPGST